VKGVPVKETALISETVLERSRIRIFDKATHDKPMPERTNFCRSKGLQY
jgi:hypothetical protein